MCSADHNEILHTPRQCYCRDMFKILLWSAEYVMKESIRNFHWISNSIEMSLMGRVPDTCAVSHLYLIWGWGIHLWDFAISVKFDMKWRWQSMALQIYMNFAWHNCLLDTSFPIYLEVRNAFTSLKTIWMVRAENQDFCHWQCRKYNSIAMSKWRKYLQVRRRSYFWVFTGPFIPYKTASL